MERKSLEAFMDWKVQSSSELSVKERCYFRDLENANVVARLSEFVYADSINEDASVAEFLDPNDWKMTAVRLPLEHTP